MVHLTILKHFQAMYRFLKEKHWILYMKYLESASQMCEGVLSHRIQVWY